MLGIVSVTVPMIYFQVYKVNIGDLANAKWPAAKKAKKSFLVFAHFSKDIPKKIEKFKLTESTDKKNLFAAKCKLVMLWDLLNQCTLPDHITIAIWIHNSFFFLFIEIGSFSF